MKLRSLPWERGEEHESKIGIYSKKENRNVAVVYGNSLNDSEMEKLFSLFMAAPELLNALKAMYACVRMNVSSEDDIPYPVRKIAEMAIAKAEGDK